MSIVTTPFAPLGLCPIRRRSFSRRQPISTARQYYRTTQMTLSRYWAQVFAGTGFTYWTHRQRAEAIRGEGA